MIGIFRVFARFAAGEEARWPGRDRSNRKLAYLARGPHARADSGDSPLRLGIAAHRFRSRRTLAGLAHRRLRLRDPERPDRRPLARRAGAKSYFWGQVDAFSDVAFNAAALMAAAWAGVSAPGLPLAYRRWALSFSCGACAVQGVRMNPCPRMRRENGRGCFSTPWWASSSARRVCRGLACAHIALARPSGISLRPVPAHPERALASK